MTKILIDRSVVEQALETFEEVAQWASEGDPAHPASQAIDALRTALEQPQGEQEPVAWLKEWSSVGNARTGMRRVDLTPECETWLANMFPTITPLYTHPQPKRKPLTDEQIKAAFLAVDLFEEGDELLGYEVDITRAIEAMHGIGGEA